MPLLSGAGALSGIWENCEIGNPGVWAVANSDVVLKHDFIDNGVYPIMMFANQVFQLWTVDKPVKDLADMKGLKVRSSGGVMDLIIKSLGAVPASRFPPPKPMKPCREELWTDFWCPLPAATPTGSKKYANMEAGASIYPEACWAIS